MCWDSKQNNKTEIIWEAKLLGFVVTYYLQLLFLFLGHKSQKRNEAAEDPFSFNDLNFIIDFCSPDKFLAVVFSYIILQSNAKSEYWWIYTFKVM